MFEVMPHSYGLDLAALGLRGARNRDATRLSAPKISASTRRAKIGRYWAMTGSLLLLGRGLEGLGFGEVRLEGLVPVVEHQDEDDEEAEADHEEVRRLGAHVALIADHDDRDDRLGRIDLGD